MRAALAIKQKAPANGPEYISQALPDWTEEQQITLLYIQPGEPTQSAYIERFNRTVSHEWLDLHDFNSVEQAQFLATEWLRIYNNERAHTAIGGIPPRHLPAAAWFLLKRAVENGRITMEGKSPGLRLSERPTRASLRS